MQLPVPVIDALLNLAGVGDTKTIRERIKSGVNPNLADARGRTMLRQAVLHGQVAMVRLLIRAGASIKGRTTRENLLSLAKRPEIVRILIAAGADPNGRDNNGRTPIFEQVSRSVPVLRELLKNGADPNIRDRFGMTALMEAVRDQCPAAVRALSEHGADWSIKSRTGKTALDYADTEQKRLFKRRKYV